MAGTDTGIVTLERGLRLDNLSLLLRHFHGSRRAEDSSKSIRLSQSLREIFEINEKIWRD